MVKKRDWVCFSCDVYSRMIWILGEFCFLQAKTLTARSRGQNNLKGHPTIFFFFYWAPTWLKVPNGASQALLTFFAKCFSY